jgi:hypothetical protein
MVTPFLTSLQCNVVIWLDYSFLVIAYRLIQRTFERSFIDNRGSRWHAIITVLGMLPIAPLLLANQYRLNWNRRRAYTNDIKRIHTAATTSQQNTISYPTIVVFHTPAEAQAYAQQVVQLSRKHT